MQSFPDDHGYPAATKGDILIVEDTPSSLLLLSNILSDAGHSVRQAQDGKMANLTVKAMKPDLILLDIAMPIMDGYEVCQMLKANPATRDIPVIFLSALHDTKDKLKGFAVGAVDFISKPYHADEVLVRVQTHLELGRLREDLEARVQQRTAELQEAMRELTEEIALRRKAQEELRIAGKVFEGAFDGIMVADQRGEIVSVNSSFTRITGYSQSEVIGRRSEFMHSERQDDGFYADAWNSVAKGGSWTGEVWNRRKDGNVVPMLETITHIREGQSAHYISTLKDLSESKDAQTLINFLAYHDALTGLPNRSVARDHFERIMSTNEPGGKIAVLCFGVDRFKLINDSLGHAIGDQVLKIVASKLSALLGEDDLLSRHGGDEFLLVASSINDAAAATTQAKHLMAVLDEDFYVDEHRLKVTASVGVAMYPSDGVDLEGLIRSSSNALNQAKKSGGNSCCCFTPEMDAEARARMEIETRLRSAIANEEFEVVYQPKASLASGQICGAEALLRWHSPVLGNVSPADFIPLAEESGLILAIDTWVLDAVCAQVRKWLDAGLGEIRVSVNLSALQFRQLNLFDVVQRALGKFGIPASCMEFEITERALVDNTENAISQLHLLKEIGVAVSVDDFGTGYSSLSYLKNFPIDTLKIDKSFIDDVHANSNDAAIALTIIELAHNLRMSVVAEGVENNQQCEFLRQHGCDAIQGYFFSKPLSHGDFERMFRSRRALAFHDAWAS